MYIYISYISSQGRVRDGWLYSKLLYSKAGAGACGAQNLSGLRLQICLTALLTNCVWGWQRPARLASGLVDISPD